MFSDSALNDSPSSNSAPSGSLDGSGSRTLANWGYSHQPRFRSESARTGCVFLPDLSVFDQECPCIYHSNVSRTRASALNVAPAGDSKTTKVSLRTTNDDQQSTRKARHSNHIDENDQILNGRETLPICVKGYATDPTTSPTSS